LILYHHFTHQNNQNLDLNDLNPPFSTFQLVGKKHVVRVVGPGKSFEGAGHSSGLPTMRWFMVLDPEMVWFENLG
jgi:hypothetical protein